MAESEEVDIEILDIGRRKYKNFTAVIVRQVACNIIERSCVEILRQPWTRSDGEISYDFGDYASPPLGQCELDMAGPWTRYSTTSLSAFIVVEEVKGTSHRIILAPSARKGPEVPPASNDIYIVGVRNRTKGKLPFPVLLIANFVDDRITEQQQEQKDRVQVAAQRRPVEKAQDDAKILERREKKRQEEEEAAQRAKPT